MNSNYPPYLMPRVLLSIDGASGNGADEEIDASAFLAASVKHGEIPKALYTARIARGTRKRSNTSDADMIHFECEIVAPDVVESQTTAGQTCATAGRRFDMYATIDPNSKGFRGGVELLGKLGLLIDNKVKPSLIVDAANSGSLFFTVILESEETFHRLPKRPGQREGDFMLVNGQKVSRGCRPALPGAEHITARVEAPPGFVAAPF